MTEKDQDNFFWGKSVTCAEWVVQEKNKKFSLTANEIKSKPNIWPVNLWGDFTNFRLYVWFWRNLTGSVLDRFQNGWKLIALRLKNLYSPETIFSLYLTIWLLFLWNRQIFIVFRKNWGYLYYNRLFWCSCYSPYVGWFISPVKQMTEDWTQELLQCAGRVVIRILIKDFARRKNRNFPVA